MPAAVTIDGQSAALTPLLPARGTYYDATKSGIGITVDVSQSGYVFLAYYGYDAMGVPTWYSVQGQWSPSTEAQRVATGVIGTLSQPLLRSSGGQCLTCDFTSKPTITPQSYTVTASWTTPRHVDITIGSQSWHMDAGQFGVGDEDLLTGTWQAAVSWGYDSRLVFVRAQPVVSASGIIRIGDGVVLPSFIVSIGRDPAADPSTTLPPMGSKYYLMGGAATLACTGTPSAQFYGTVFADVLSAVKLSTAYTSGITSVRPMAWYDAATRHGGLDIVTQASGIDRTVLLLGPNNVHFDLYIEPDRIVGHGVVQGPNTNGIPDIYWAPNVVALNLVMQRLPAGIVEGAVRDEACPVTY